MKTDMIPAKNTPEQVRPLVFEVSWEICSQTGGIYTVLRSKAPAATKQWGDDYFCLGAYRQPGASIEFEPTTPPPFIADVLDTLKQRGLIFHFGRWLITGRPQVILCDLTSVFSTYPDLKYYYWKDCYLATPDGDSDCDQILALGRGIADFLAELHKRLNGRPMQAHFHEWQGGAALPLLKTWQVSFPTIFTTHATLVGRALAAANADLYENLRFTDPGAVATEHGFRHRYDIERAAANCADVFTTVSGITALEAEHFLGRKPDALLPNGLNVERFSAPYQFQNLHRRNKQLIHEFVMGHFFPSYRFDLDQTLYMFTAGRYEYRNKGLDITIEALHQLNQRLKANPNGTTVIAFIIAPAPSRSLNVTTLNRQAMFNELIDTCESISRDMSKRLFKTVAEGRLPGIGDLLEEYDRVRLMRMMHAWHQEALPSIVTHDLADDCNDQILNHLRHRGLINNADDPVKVVFHPEFITSTSPILGLEYDEFVRGCNLGIFPSYYEPWGYTPMECVIRGIPALTSDLSGFGAYVMSHFPDHNRNGIYVAHRRRVHIDETIHQVTNWLEGFAKMSPRERIELRNRVESHADHFDWSHLTKYYRIARRQGFEMYYPDANILGPDVVDTDQVKTTRSTEMSTPKERQTRKTRRVRASKRQPKTNR